MDVNVITLASGLQYEEHAPGCWQAVDRNGPQWPGCMSLQAMIRDIEHMTVLHNRQIRSGPTRAERKRAKHAGVAA